MNLQAILVANLTGFFLIFFLLVSRAITRTKSATEEHALNAMMVLTMIACVVEPLTFYIDGRPGKLCYWISMLGGTYLYYANAIGAFLWCMFVDLSLFHDYDRMKKIYRPLSIPIGILLISLFGNIWGHYYFYVDENNVYQRQPGVNVFYFYVIICALYSLFLYLRHRLEVGRAAFFPIYMYLIPIMTGSVLQMLFYGMSLAWLGTSIGIVALYMSIQNQKAYLDDLTGLFNRSYLEHTLYTMSRDTSGSYYGIMIDMNYFKSINDSYGHSVGDEALVKAAEIIKKAVSKLGTVYRFAGDEFIVILKTGDEADVLAVEKEIREQGENFNKTGAVKYKLSFAMGHDSYHPQEDNADSFLRGIDTAMYRDKERIHGGR